MIVALKNSNREGGMTGIVKRWGKGAMEGTAI